MMYNVNLDNVIKSADAFPIAADLAVLVKMNGMVTVKGFLQSIEDDKLNHLMDQFDADILGELPAEKSFAINNEILLISIIIRQAEGLEISSNQSVLINDFNLTKYFLVFESMHRLGLVELDHSKLTYDEMVNDKLFVKLTDAGREYLQRFYP